MILPATFTLLAAISSVGTFAEAGSSETSLSVSATVVRPVDISSPVINAEGAVVIVKNAATVEMQVVGGTVTQLDQDTSIITGDRSGSMAITIVY